MGQFTLIFVHGLFLFKNVRPEPSILCGSFTLASKVLKILISPASFLTGAMMHNPGIVTARLSRLQVI